MVGCREICDVILRRRTLQTDLLATPLRRCLTTFDLIVIGIGQMIGTGIFVLSGVVTATMAGPGVVLSFLFAGVAALLSAFCFAEFGARVPKTGSSYLFTYLVLGELPAFVCGWCIIFENIIGVATNCRAISGAIDSFFNYAIQNATINALGKIDVPWLSPYPDFLTILPLVVLITFVIAGAKATALFNRIFTTIQVLGLVFIIGLGFTKADIKNWTDPERGGFLPYGFGGVLTGAGSCFYAYVGFDTIVVAGEETVTPQRSIPVALMISMSVVTLLYVLMSCVISLMLPYTAIDLLAPLPSAFKTVGLPWAQYVVGAILMVALTTSLISTIYAMPRVLYAMADDGLLFKCFAYINPRTQTPIFGIISSAFLAGILAIFIDLAVLVELYSIGTLLSFTLAAMALIMLHYTPVDDNAIWTIGRRSSPSHSSDKTALIDGQSEEYANTHAGHLKPFARRFPILSRMPPSGLNIKMLMTALFLSQTCFSVVLAIGYHSNNFLSLGVLIPAAVLFVVSIVPFGLLCLHTTNRHSTGFRVPLSPLLPALSMWVNIFLMFMLKPITWARLVIWLLLGLIVYTFYSVDHSKEKQRRLTENSDVTGGHHNRSDDVIGLIQSASGESEEDSKRASYGTMSNRDASENEDETKSK